MSRRVLIIAGEISGDMHAAKLVREIKAIDPTVSFYGIGGDLLEAEGVEVRYHVRDMAVLGLSEVLRRYGFFRRVFNELVAAVKKDPPDMVLLVDYPGFNLRFAKQMKKQGVKICYYICPQVWAWKKGRIPKMVDVLDRLLVIFPFEVDLFKGYDLPVHYVGHPLAAEVAHYEASGLANRLDWSAANKLALLPGSRKQEIERILPPLLETVRILTRANRELSVILAAASPQIAELARIRLTEYPDLLERIRIEVDQTRAILLRADAAIVASGTATLEAALCRCPMVVVYKTAALTYAVGKRVVKIPHIGMVNIVAGKEICPEFIQEEVCPDRIASTMSSLLEESQACEKMKGALDEVRNALNTTAGDDAAELILSELV